MAKVGEQFHFASIPNILKGGSTVSLSDLKPISVKNMQQDQSSIQNTPDGARSPVNSPQIEELSPSYDPNQPNTTELNETFSDKSQSEQNELNSSTTQEHVNLNESLPKVSISPTTISTSPSSGGKFSGQKVLPIDTKVASTRLREVKSPGLVSPLHPRSPSPALGSILQTRSDMTPTRVAGTIYSSVPHQTYPPAITPDQVPRARTNESVASSTIFNQQPNWQEFSQNSQNISGAQAINDFIAQLPTKMAPSPTYYAPPTAPVYAQAPPIKKLPEAIPQQLDPEEIQRRKVAEAKSRANYRVKFGILREGYPKMEIPEPTEDQSLEEIEAMYREYVKRIHVDSSVEQNKVYLLILWLLIEVVGCRFLRLPFGGYTMNQFKYMNKYQMLLVELGERSYESTIGEGWPVEIRIGIMAIFNAVIFILVKMLADKVGSDMAEQLRELIANFLTQNQGTEVLQRASQATADNPPPPAAPQEASPPLGGLGNLIAQLASTFAGGLGGQNAGANQTQAQPQLRRPTTFASRRKRGPSDN